MWKEDSLGTFWTGNEGGTLWDGEHVTATPVLAKSVWALLSLHSKQHLSELEAQRRRVGGDSWANMPGNKGRWPILP